MESRLLYKEGKCSFSTNFEIHTQIFYQKEELLLFLPETHFARNLTLMGPNQYS